MVKQPLGPLKRCMVSNMLRLPPNVSRRSNKLLVADLTFSTKFEVKLCLMTTAIIIVSHFERQKGNKIICITCNMLYSQVELFNIVVFLPPNN